MSRAWSTRWLGALGVCFGLLPAPAFADSVLDAVRIGASRADVESALARAGARDVRWVDSRASQAMTEGLITSGMLAALNGHQLAPRDAKGELDAGAFGKFAFAVVGGRRYTFAFSDQGRLTAALVVIPVPVNAAKDGQDGWSPDRLHLLHETVRELEGWGLRPTQRDQWKNVTAWEGATKAGRARADYLPAQDRLRVLVFGR